MDLALTIFVNKYSGALGSVGALPQLRHNRQRGGVPPPGEAAGYENRVNAVLPPRFIRATVSMNRRASAVPPPAAGGAGYRRQYKPYSIDIKSN